MYCKFCGNKINTTKCTFCGANINIYDGGQSFFTEDDIAEWKASAAVAMPVTEMRENPIPSSAVRRTPRKKAGILSGSNKIIALCIGSLIAIVLIAVGISALLNSPDEYKSESDKISKLQFVEYFGAEMGESAAVNIAAELKKNKPITTGVEDVWKWAKGKLLDSGKSGNSTATSIEVAATTVDDILYISANDFLEFEGFKSRKKDDGKLSFEKNSSGWVVDFLPDPLSKTFWYNTGDKKPKQGELEKDIIKKDDGYYVPAEEFLKKYSEIFYKGATVIFKAEKGDDEATVTKTETK